MKISIATTILFIVTLINIPYLTSANFFPNVTSIPTSLIPNTSTWDEFNKLKDCHKGQKVDGVSKIKKYFQNFGYLNSSYSNFSDDFDDYLETAVKSYQLNFNLNATGQLDVPTLKHVVLPRCGNQDIINGTSTMLRSSNIFNNTVAHYSFFPGRPRWPPRTSQLDYAFAPENQLTDVVRNVFARAFERWSEVIPISFNETSNYARADIRIGFFSMDHGDGEPFDGVMGTLAHAFSPPAGLFHLDLDENWIIDGNFVNGSPFTAMDLESVAVHEIGHILGLGHSSIEEAIMYPTISSGTRKVELANDDVRGVQELYGANPSYNGSDPSLTPRGERDSSGAYRVGCSMWGSSIVFVVGLLLSSMLFV